MSDSLYAKWQALDEVKPYKSNDLRLEEDEWIYFHEDDVQLLESTTMSATRTVGKTNSLDLYWGHGISTSEGAIDAVSRESKWQEKAIKAIGSLYLTNKQLLYVSEMETRNIPLENVISVKCDGRFWLIVSVKGLSLTENFSCLGARVFKEAHELLCAEC